MKELLINFYMDWFCNFLTVERMAEHYDLPVEETRQLIEIGRKLQAHFAETGGEPLY